MEAESRWSSYPRVLKRFLYSYSMIIVPLYLLMVFSARRIMKLFSPMQLRGPLILHNVICCITSIVTLCLLSASLWEGGSLLKLSISNEYLSLGLYIYWLSKYYELLDTVFMILRHKSRQISFLHVFHHSSMPFLADYGYHYAPWPPVGFGLALNSFVHIVMYSYYAMTACIPLHDFTWKKLITQLQIAQFIIGVVVGLSGYLNEGYCVFAFLYPLALIGLFSNYYYHAFFKRKFASKKSS